MDGVQPSRPPRPVLPGRDDLRSNGDHFEGSIKIKIGPLALVYNGSGRFLERDAEARRLVFQASGDDRRGNGTATAKVTASLVGNGSGTDVELTTDLDFTGRPAQFGSGVVSDVSDKLFDQFVSCVSVRFADGSRGPGARGRGRGRGAGGGGRRAVGGVGRRGVGRGGRTPSDEQPTVEMAAVGTAVANDTGADDETTVAGRDARDRNRRRPRPLPRRPTATPRPATSPRPTPTWWPTWWAPCSGATARCSGSCPWWWSS